MRDPRFCLASCQHCGQHIEFPAEGIGLLAVCPHCAKETILTEELQRVQDGVQEITAGELKAALAGVVPRRRISIFYQAGLLIVAIVMILLPVAYLAVAASTVYAVYWYAIHTWAFFTSFSGGIYVSILKAVLYIGPLLGGMIAVIFMFKPIFARRRKHAEPVELNPSHHPRLYQFIAHITDLLRVSMPKRIYLDCDQNASAGFRRGWLSFLGNDLVLRLGLPLVAGLDTRQFAAVVAHELGHCTQAFAMRLGYVIDQIDGWFMRVVYERDTWDEAFEEWANSVEDSRLLLVVGCARLAVWCSRKLLLLLMLIGHAASCFLSRQMEFHADRSAMAVAGTAGLESLLVRLREQALLEKLAYVHLRHIWQKRHQMPDSLPDFLERLEQSLPESFREEARRTLLNETAGWFATHPTAAQRIQKARRQSVEGIFSMAKPSRALFNDFTGTAKLVTARHYRQNLRLAVTNPMLKPAGDFFAENDAPTASIQEED